MDRQLVDLGARGDGPRLDTELETQVKAREDTAGSARDQPEATAVQDDSRDGTVANGVGERPHQLASDQVHCNDLARTRRVHQHRLFPLLVMLHPNGMALAHLELADVLGRCIVLDHFDSRSKKKKMNT